MADVYFSEPEIVISQLSIKSPYLSEKSSRFRYKFDTQQHIWNSMTVTWRNMNFLKIQDGGHTPYWKCYLGHNSAADFSISVKFCVGKQFFTKFRQWNRYPRSTQNVLFVFLWTLGFGERRLWYRLRYTCITCML